MIGEMRAFLENEWGISKELLRDALEAEMLTERFAASHELVRNQNSLKVLDGFQSAGIRESHLIGSHGYGYHDFGRDAVDALYARIFRAEAALVRPQLVSGTHAIRAALCGVLRPGDHVVVIPAVPYDTLLPVFGFREAPGSLAEWGITPSGLSIPDILEGEFNLPQNTKAVFIQRSKGYRWQLSISIDLIARLISKIKGRNPRVNVIVDNCYGEFVEEREPTEVGADLVIGSLLKNPGGGLCSTGAYLAGKSDLIERAAVALTAPGLGKEVGPTLGLARNFLMGIFMAPHFVSEALTTSIFASAFFEKLGFKVNPEPAELRTDIIQAIELGSRDAVLAFARGIQRAGPLDQTAIPVAAPMAGYTDEIVMSGGTFVQGGSLELSCDAPLRPPYVAYLQGGLSSLHGKLGVLLAAEETLKTVDKKERIAHERLHS